MAQIESGRTLSLGASKIYKGEATDSGMLLKLHENSFTTGYAKLTPKTGDTGVKFGYGVFYADADGKTNEVTPVRDTDCPFAGILARQNYIAEGIPNENDEVAPWNRGLLVKEGFVIYKQGLDSGTAQTYADVSLGMKLLIDVTDGSAYFAVDTTAVGEFNNAGTYFCAGKVVQMNPDDSSWTVKVSC